MNVLTEMKRAAAILGEIPIPAAGIGTQEPVYRAYKILTDEIDRIESAGRDSAATPAAGA